MKLNKNSISAKLYRWFYCTDELPVSLCPYFWKLVAAWLFLIPVGVIRLPLFVIVPVTKLNFSGKLFSGIFIWVVTFICFCLLVPFFLFFTDFAPNTFMFRTCSAGIVIWVVLIIIGIVLGILKLVDYLKDRKRNKQVRDEFGRIVIPEKTPNIVGEFVKAKYNKYCPKIEWVDSENTKTTENGKV